MFIVLLNILGILKIYHSKSSEISKNINYNLLFSGYTNKKTETRYIFVNFLEYYCKPCIEEISLMNEIVDEKNPNIDFYGVYSAGNKDKLLKNIERVGGGTKLEILPSKSDSLRLKLCTLYAQQENSMVEICALPSTFIMDLAEQKIIYRKNGGLSNEDIQDLKEIIFNLPR